MCVYGYKVNIYTSNTNSVSSKTEKVHWRLSIDYEIIVERDYLSCMTYQPKCKPASLLRTKGGKRERQVKLSFLEFASEEAKSFTSWGKAALQNWLQIGPSHGWE